MLQDIYAEWQILTVSLQLGDDTIRDQMQTVHFKIAKFIDDRGKAKW